MITTIHGTRTFVDPEWVRSERYNFCDDYSYHTYRHQNGFFKKLFGRFSRLFG